MKLETVTSWPVHFYQQIFSIQEDEDTLIVRFAWEKPLHRIKNNESNREILLSSKTILLTISLKAKYCLVDISFNGEILKFIRSK